MLNKLFNDSDEEPSKNTDELKQRNITVFLPTSI